MVKYMENNLDIRKPPYSKQIFPVVWAFFTSRFHCNENSYSLHCCPLVRLWHFIYSFICSFIHQPLCLPKINTNFSLGAKICRVQLLEIRFKPIMSFSMGICEHHCIFSHQSVTHQEFFCELKLLVSSSYHDTDDQNKNTKKAAALSKTRTLNLLHTSKNSELAAHFLADFSSVARLMFSNLTRMAIIVTWILS